MKEVVISLGSNCSDRHIKMKCAIEWIRTLLSDVSISDVYETPALGGGAPYLNAVAIGNSDLSSESINFLFKNFERESGRDDYCRKNGIVPIDIDLVIYNNQILRPSDYKRDFFRIGYNKISGAE